MIARHERKLALGLSVGCAERHTGIMGMLRARLLKVKS